MNVSDVCSLICCPPTFSGITAKLAFMPPLPTYTVIQLSQPQPIATPLHHPYQLEQHVGVASQPVAQYSLQLQHCSRDRPEPPRLPFTTHLLVTDLGHTIVCVRFAAPHVTQSHVQSHAQSYTLIYSHGNASDLGQNLISLSNLAILLRNIHVVSYDYSGYGCSSGRPSERHVISDLRAVRRFVTQGFTEPHSQHTVAQSSSPAEAAAAAYTHDYVTTNNSAVRPANCTDCCVILYGESIGTVPTVAVAAEGPPVAAVVLHSPLLSGLSLIAPICYAFCCPCCLTDDVTQQQQQQQDEHDDATKHGCKCEKCGDCVSQRGGRRAALSAVKPPLCCRVDATCACVDVLTSKRRIPLIRSPTLVMHGRADETIPFAQGEEIAQRVPSEFRLEPLWLDKAGHDDLPLCAEYESRLIRLVSVELPAIAQSRANNDAITPAAAAVSVASDAAVSDDAITAAPQNNDATNTEETAICVDEAVVIAQSQHAFEAAAIARLRASKRLAAENEQSQTANDATSASSAASSNSTGRTVAE